MIRDKFLMILCCLLISPYLGAQATDSVLTYDTFLEIIRNNHPVFYQSNLLQEQADANRMMAAGGFDPKLEVNYDNKSFDGKNYYSILQTSLKIPTWFGPDLKVGYDRTSGDFLNESDRLPRRGIWNAGISVPIGRGLIIDQRRSEMMKAKVFAAATLEERKIMLNDLIFEASKAYLDWQKNYNYWLVFREGVALAEVRFQASVESFINGDKPAIDTLESYISLQNREQDLMIARQELDNSQIQLQNFLWLDGYIPLEVNEGVFPEGIIPDRYKETVDSLVLLQQQVVDTHPEIRLYDYKLDQLDIDQKLGRENLKPDLRISYNPLVGVNENRLFDTWNWDNYKLGASFSFPLLLRKERGKLALTQLKIRETGYDRDIKKQSIDTKLDNYYNNTQVVADQLDLQEDMVINYQRMLNAENRKFEIGEISVFLVNSRESKYLESRKKLINIQIELLKNRLTYIFNSAALR